jgi:hypothetical protein
MADRKPVSASPYFAGLQMSGMSTDSSVPHERSLRGGQEQFTHSQEFARTTWQAVKLALRSFNQTRYVGALERIFVLRGRRFPGAR